MPYLFQGTRAYGADSRSCEGKLVKRAAVKGIEKRKKKIMSVTDPIADYLVRVRNALHAGHKYVDIPASKLKKGITKILLERKYIKNYMLIRDSKQGLIRVYVRYDKNGESIINGMRRVSRPGLRRYVGAESLPRVRNNLGAAVVSTSQGVMTNFEAKRRGVGGEVLFYIW